MSEEKKQRKPRQLQMFATQERIIQAAMNNQALYMKIVEKMKAGDKTAIFLEAEVRRRVEAMNKLGEELLRDL